MVATPDLGAVAARALLAPPRSSESVDVVGPTYSERVVAAMLGATLGRDLHVALIPQPGGVDALVAAGFQPHVAESLAELYGADERGLLAPRGNRSARVDTGLESTLEKVLER